MKHNSYLKSTTNVSAIGLGAWQLGMNSGWKELSESEAESLVKSALDLGINFFDTAPNYGYGTGETRLGNALKGIDRDTIVINTKFGHTDRGTMNYESDYIRRSLEGSLRRLKVDYVDSLIIHNPPPSYLDGNKNDHYEILERLIEEGKIKGYGASIDTASDLRLLLNTTNSKVIEAFYNILHQDIASAFDLAQQKSAAIIAKIPLDSGWLSGKYTANSTFTGVRSRWSKEEIRQRAELIDELKQIIGSDRVLPEVAVAFCAAHPAVSTVIPGALSKDQLVQNVQSVLSPTNKDLIEQLRDFYTSKVAALQLPW
jgi:aryl-alcohol dehydrogenase-like predicted oxidoreductase